MSEQRSEGGWVGLILLLVVVFLGVSGNWPKDWPTWVFWLFVALGLVS